MRPFSQSPGIVFFVPFSFSPVSHRCFSFHISLIPAKRLAGSSSQPPWVPSLSRGPVPRSRARTFSSASSRGQARGQRVASPAPRSGGGGDASGLCLRRELREEVSLSCVNWCGCQRRKGVGQTPDRETGRRPPFPAGDTRGFSSSLNIAPLTLQQLTVLGPHFSPSS